MKIRIAVVDLSALPQWPSRVLAIGDVHASTDRFFAARFTLGKSLAPPPRIAVTGLPTPEGDRSRLILTEIEP